MNHKAKDFFLTYHPALWAPLLQLEEGNGDTPNINNFAR